MTVITTPAPSRARRLKWPGLSPEQLASLLHGKPYRWVRFLGRGGMGEVHVVEHEFLRCQFALKVLHSRTDRLGDRLRVEAQALGRVNHRNVVGVVDFWTDASGLPCVLMELLDGHTVAFELEARPIVPVAEATHWICQALAALEVAHGLGIVHRDIKPENLFLHNSAGYGTVLKVLDFGMARVMPDAVPFIVEPPQIPTSTGAVLGSPRFMSPEAAKGKRVDARADLYSLGLLLYLMLAGIGPGDDGSSPQTPPSRYNPKIPADLDLALIRAIQEDPMARFQSATEMLKALKSFAATKQTP